MEQNEFIIDFTDITLNETDGDFKATKEIMLKEPPFNDKWVLRSNVSISSDGGEGMMEIQCHGDGSFYILQYEGTIGEVFYNSDIQAVSMWAQANGWDIPQPHPDLVKEKKEFWKYFYDTLVIDSDYLDKLYGVRPHLKGGK